MKNLPNQSLKNTWCVRASNINQGNNVLGWWNVLLI